jgi:hypothetical protein
LLLILVHGWQFADELFCTHSLYDYLTSAVLAVPVDEQLAVFGDPVRERFFAHGSPLVGGFLLRERAPHCRQYFSSDQVVGVLPYCGFDFT